MLFTEKENTYKNVFTDLQTTFYVKGRVFI